MGARIDLTWGSPEFHRQSMVNLQVAMRKTRKLCCTLVDTVGRELMIQGPVSGLGWGGLRIMRELQGSRAHPRAVVACKVSVWMGCTLVNTNGRELMIQGH